MDGALGDGHESFLRALSEDAQIAVVEEQVRHFQRHQFAHAQAARKQHLDDGTVALSFPFRQVDARFNLVHFGGGEHFGQVFAQVGRFEQFRGVVGNVVLELQEAVERADAAENPRLRTRSDAQFVERGSEVLQVLQLHVERLHTLATAVVEQVAEVALIGLQRVRRIVALEFQVAHVSSDDIFVGIRLFFHEKYR